MRNVVLACIALIVLTLAVYAQVAGFEFLSYDDPGHVENVPQLREGLSIPGIAWAIKYPLPANYIPVVSLTYLADYEGYGLDPGGYHVTNLVFHIANALLLLLFFGWTTKRWWPAALLAALFAVHPLHVESVAWISARKDVVSTFFWLLTLFAWVGYTRKPGFLRYALTTALLVLGLLSKSMVVTLPFALILLDIWPLKRVDIYALGSAEQRRVAYRIMLEKVPMLLPVFCASAVTFVLQQSSGAMTASSGLSVIDRVSNALVSYVAYLGYTIWPADLVVHYSYRSEGLTLAHTLGAAAILLAITTIAVLAGRHRSHLLIGWLWFLGTLVPVIGLVQVGSQAMADRYTYVPLIGVFVAVAWSLAEFADRSVRARPAIATVSVIVVLLYATAAWRQVSYWRDSVTLFTHLLEVDPDSTVGHSVLGKEMLDIGEYERAAEHLEPFLTQEPLYRVGATNLGHLYIAQGKLEDALECFTLLLRENPDNAFVYKNLGTVLFLQGKRVEAAAQLEIALEKKPNLTEAMITLGTIRLEQDRPHDALPLLLQAVELMPYDADAHLTLAIAYRDTGELERAQSHAEESLRLDPTNEAAQEFSTLLERESP